MPRNTSQRVQKMIAKEGFEQRENKRAHINKKKQKKKLKKQQSKREELFKIAGFIVVVIVLATIFIK